MLQLLSGTGLIPYLGGTIMTLIALLLPFLVTYLVTVWKAATAVQGRDAKPSRPPTLPYVVPWLGHVFEFLSDGSRVLASGVGCFGPHVPFKLILGPSRVYVISGAELVAALFKATKETSGNRNTILAMEYAFGAPRKSVEFYEADDSGLLPNAIPGCKTRPADRIFYITHKLVTTFLSGPNLTPITARFQEGLTKIVSEPDFIGAEWVDIPDLYSFLQVQVLEAAVRAILGEYILSLNPTFIQDFCEYDRGMRGLFMRTPRWMNPGIYRTRDKMVENIKRWHRYALEHCDLSTIADDIEWEPYWGTRFERYRQAAFHKWKALDETARAAEDLGAIWAMNANSVPAAVWMLLEIISSPTLESRVRTELLAALGPVTPGTNGEATVPSYDAVKLSSSPLLQSIYAETLRVRVAIMGTRAVTAPTFSLSNWRFRKGDILTYTSSLSAMDRTVWNPGEDRDPHPLDAFWADRFLNYPGDSTSGPLLRPAAQNKMGAKSPVHDAQPSTDGLTQPQFSLEGLAASWIPYGGGQRLCPGRHFAKQEMLVSTAIWLGAWEIQLHSTLLEVDKSYFGFGTMPPKGKIRARVRRRVEGRATS